MSMSILLPIQGGPTNKGIAILCAETVCQVIGQLIGEGICQAQGSFEEYLLDHKVKLFFCVLKSTV